MSDKTLRIVAIGLLILCAAMSTAHAQDPSMVGQWSPTYPMPDIAANLLVLPNGNVVLWQGSQIEADHPTKVFVVPIPTGGAPSDVIAMPTAATDIFASAHTFLENGNFITIGGTFGGSYNGTPFVNTFNTSKNTWSVDPNMSGSRYFPSAITLTNGSILALGGTTFPDMVKTPTLIPEVSNTIGGGWKQLTNAPMPPNNVHADQYTRVHLAPNGQVFMTSPSIRSFYLNTAGLGLWTFVAASNFKGVGTMGRIWDASVMYDDGKILIIGGGQIPTDTVEAIDLNVSDPAWQFINPMNFARRWLNGTILPDGTILVTGGTSLEDHDPSGAILPAEIFNPATGDWTVLASMSHPRVEQSTAALLPDGRVFSAGSAAVCDPGGNCTPNFFDADLYSPPYLFNGARPTITSAPPSVGYGQQFDVESPDTDITLITLLRLGSVYGGFNSNQRIERPAFTAATGGYLVTAPSNHNTCPPGHYMMFLINSAGVPSIASVIQIK